MADTLTIPVAGRYFDEILAGTKPEEYRVRSDYWDRRLFNREYHSVVLTRGYPKGGGVEGETRLTLPWRGWEWKTITHEFFGPHPVDVYAIRVSRDSGSDRHGEDAAQTAAECEAAQSGGESRIAQPHSGPSHDK